MTSQVEVDEFYAEQERRMNLDDQGRPRPQRHIPRNSTSIHATEITEGESSAARQMMQNASNASQCMISVQVAPQSWRDGVASTTRSPVQVDDDDHSATSLASAVTISSSIAPCTTPSAPTNIVPLSGLPDWASKGRLFPSSTNFKRSASPQPDSEKDSKRCKTDASKPLSTSINVPIEDISMFTEDSKSTAASPVPVCKVTTIRSKGASAAAQSMSASSRQVKPIRLVPVTSTSDSDAPLKKSAPVKKQIVDMPNNAQTSKATASTSTTAKKTNTTASKGKSSSWEPIVAKRPVKSISTKKIKPKSMFPHEYAKNLLQQVEEGKFPYRKGARFLTGKTIFYWGGDRSIATECTTKKMERLINWGATLQAEFDPTTITQIVTDGGKISTLEALKLKRLDDIPSHVPTVTWDWVVACYKLCHENGKRLDKDGNRIFDAADYGFHAAFIERFEAGLEMYTSKLPKGKGGQKATSPKPLSADESDTDNEAAARPKPIRKASTVKSESMATSGSSRRNMNTLYDIEDTNKGNDPLAEFYAQARAEHEQGIQSDIDMRSTSDVDSEIEDEPGLDAQVPQSNKGQWTCDKKHEMPLACPNQDVIDKLQELMDIHKSKPGYDDKWKVFSYSKSIRGIKTYPKRIMSYEEACKIPGVGVKTADKIMEIIQTGELKRIGYETDQSVVSTRLFMGIYGVGQHTALRWFLNGCRTLEDVKNRKGGIKLSAAQEVGLEYYDGKYINNRMPRAEAERIFNMIKPIALTIDNKLTVDIMGSFRRGKADCGDIDILITRPTQDGKTHAGMMGRLWKDLHKAGILTEDLSMPDNMNDLECCYRGLCALPEPGSLRRRIDILTVPWHCRGAALIYYTGDDIFNRAMRLKANKMGYSLNQRGLYGGVVRDPKNPTVKMNRGYLVESETEEKIFKVMNVPWQEPHERVRNFATK